MSKRTQPDHEPIAVIGIGALFPGSQEPGGFWRDIISGRDLISDIPTHYWLTEDFYSEDFFAQDKTYAKRGAFLSKIEFDPMYYGIPPKNIPATDTSQLLALVVARQVLEDAARGPFEKQNKERMSCIIGVAAGLELLGEMGARLQKPIWVKAMRELGLPEDQVQEICDYCLSMTVPWSEATFPGLLGNVVAGRITNRFDLGGLNCTTDAACASSFSSLSLALDELWLKHSDVVLSGGVDTCQDPFLYTCFSKTPALSFTGDCRPFSEKADGTMLGEGLGMVALKRLSDAERDGDQIYGLIRAMGASSDGRAKSIYAPSAPGQTRALQRAYQIARFGPETVELIEAHGTGTRAGDAAEVEGLRALFDPSDEERRQWCALGTIKSQFGHTKSAAGAAGLIKAIMAVHHRVLPPTIKIENPDPDIDFAKSAFYLNTETRPWVRDLSHPRRAGISSAGFGGTNYHCVVEEYTGPGTRAPRRRTCPSELVAFCGKNPDGLVAEVESLCADLRARARLLAEKQKAPPGVTKAPLGDDPQELLKVTARASQMSFDPHAGARLAVVAKDDAELLTKLEQAVTKIKADRETDFAIPTGVFYGAKKTPAPKVAFLFSGQGSQYVGMGKDLAMAFDTACEVWDRAASLALDDETELHRIVYPLPVFSQDERRTQTATLTRTEWAQPALGATSAAMLQVLRQAGITPDSVGGHSFGEVTALYAAGSIDLDALLGIARRRGELMAAAATIPGAMSAVAQPIAEVKAALDEINNEAETGVLVANHNAPNQVVLSGPTTGIEVVEQKLKAKKIAAKRLPVATAFHSPVVADSEPVFAEYLKEVEFQSPQIPVYANSRAAPYPTDREEIRPILAGQISRPVRFAEQIEAMADAGARLFVEVGAGRVLANLAAGCLKGRDDVTVISLDHKKKDGLTSLWLGLGQMAVSGVAVDFAKLWDGYQTFVDPRTVKKPVMAIELDGMNYNRPYPPKNGAAGLPKPNPPRTQGQGGKKAVTGSGAEAKKRAAATSVAPAPAPASASATASAPPSATVAAPAPASASASAPPSATAAAPAIALAAAPGLFAAPVAGAASLGWLQAFQEVQRQTTDVHTAYQQSMAEAHIAFLRAAQASTASLTSLVTGQPVRLSQIDTNATEHQGPTQTFVPALATLPVGAAPAPALAAAPPVTPAPLPDPAAPAMAPPADGQAAPAPEAPAGESSEAEVITPEVVTPELLALAEQKNPFAGVDLKEMLFSVVADKTGYPPEILNLDMNLEADLGIDSIKRVEILSAIQDQAPNLPEVDAAEIAQLQSLGEVLEFMERYRDMLDESGWSPADAEQPSLVAAATASPTVEPGPKKAKPMSPSAMMAAAAAGKIPTSGTAGGDAATEEALKKFMDANLKDLLFEVVADKTGYPPDILNLDMNLEADLGIDSIKRVEILSAFQDELPGLPEVDAAQMATLQTLGEVLDYMERMRTAAKEGKLEEFLGTQKALPAPERSVETVAADSAPPQEAQPAPITMPSAGESQHRPSTATPQVLRLAVKEAPAAASGFAMAGIYPGATAAVTDDGHGLADALVTLLGQRHLVATKITDVEQVHADTDIVIFLGALADLPDEDAAIAVNREAFRLAKVIAPKFTQAGGVFVTVQDTGGDFGLRGTSRRHAWTGGLAGLVKTARLEWSEAAVKAIDLERVGRTTDDQAETIVGELFTGGPEVEIGLHHDGRRTTVAVDPAPEPAPGTDQTLGADQAEGGPERLDGNLGPESVVLASGGARGVTAATIIELARATHARFALLGRTALTPEPELTCAAQNDAELKRVLLADAKTRGETPTPKELGKQTQAILANREIQATLLAVKQAGGDALYLTAPVHDAVALGEALNEVRDQWGPVTALVHGAGVLRDKLIADKTSEQFDQVFNTKVEGLRALLAATADDPLTAICLFSSVAGRHGNRGQCDYAMANEVLNKLATVEAKNRPNCLVKALNWGPWQGGMVTPSLEKVLDKMGVPMIPLQAGGETMVDELLAGEKDRVEVLVEASFAAGERFVDPNALDTKVGILVDQNSHSFLASHAIEDVPVVPVVMVLEWFTRAARVCHPNLMVTGCRDLRVLKGIRLEAFGEGPTAFTISIKRLTNGKIPAALEMELAGAGEQLHYRAIVELDKANGKCDLKPLAGLSDDLQPWPWSSQEAYEDKLFQRNEFQVIRSLEGVSKQGGVGTLAGIAEMGWPGGGWCTDAAALDGGLQLAQLWGAFVTGKVSLPTAVDEYVTYTGDVFNGPVQCVLLGREITQNRTKLDLAFATDDGHVAAELRGVEMHTMPS